jgi:anti-sigma B factor antagonist
VTDGPGGVESLPGEIRVQVTRTGTVTVICVHGEIDIASAPTLQAATDAMIDQGTRHLIMDLSGVEFIDSSGLATLIAANKRLPQGALALVVTREHIRKVFTISGVDQLLTVHDTLAAAHHALPPAPD